MSGVVKTGVPVLGIVFLALAAVKFLQGEGWVVWAILGLLFGGFRLFTGNGSEGSQA